MKIAPYETSLTDSQWKILCPLLPHDFPAWKTVYHHFRAWSRCGLLEAINTCLREALHRLAGKKRRPSAAIIDSQTVRVAPHGGEVGYDAGKKTKSRKRFLCVDTLGWILSLFIASAAPGTHRVHILEANGESFRLADAKRRMPKA